MTTFVLLPDTAPDVVVTRLEPEPPSAPFVSLSDLGRACLRQAAANARWTIRETVRTIERAIEDC